MSLNESRIEFGTDGVRGLANDGWLTPEHAARLGLAAGSLFREATNVSPDDPAPVVMIGRDSRPSGLMLENGLAAGLQSAGIDVIRLGLLPTPAVAALVRHEKALAGAVISASHNPAADNGIKFFGGDGYKLADEMEAQIPERFHDETALQHARVEGARVGIEREYESPLHRYLDLARNAFADGINLHGKPIIIDAANGAASEAAPAIFRELDADVTCIACDHQSGRINDGCGSTHPEALAAAVVDRQAALGIAFDGDADRVLFVDETGSVLDGDELLAIAGVYLLLQNELPDGLLVATVMSNFALDKLIESHGGRVIRTPVGDRHVIQAMRETGAALGGEQSGHLIFHRYATTGDGIVSALRILTILEKLNLPLSEARQVLQKAPQVLHNLKISRKPPLAEVPGLNEAQEAVEHELADQGRVLIRYSGTSNKVRILLEGPDRDQLQQMAERLAKPFASL